MKPALIFTLALGLLTAGLQAAETAASEAYRLGALARLADMDGKQSEALDYFNRSLALVPDAIIYGERATLKADMKDIKGAIADYDQAIALKPRQKDLATLYGNRGSLKQQLADYAGAIPDYDQAIALKPADLEILYGNRGLVKHQLGDLDGAIADYDQVIRLNPDEALAYNNRGYAKITKGDLAGAIADYSKAIALESDVIKFRDNLVNVKRDIGDLLGAIAEYDKIVSLEPELPLHYFKRGNLKLLRSDYNGAISDYDKVIELRPKSWGGSLQRGTARQVMGDLEAAFADYDQAVSVTQDHVAFGWAYREIVLRQLHRGTPNAELTKIVSKGADGFPKNIGLFLSGTLSEAEFLAGAKTTSGQCIAFYFVGMSRLFLGDQATARKFLEQSVATKRLDVSEFVLARAELGRLAPQP